MNATIMGAISTWQECRTLELCTDTRSVEIIRICDAGFLEHARPRSGFLVQYHATSCTGRAWRCFERCCTCHIGLNRCLARFVQVATSQQGRGSRTAWRHMELHSCAKHAPGDPCPGSAATAHAGAAAADTNTQNTLCSAAGVHPGRLRLQHGGPVERHPHGGDACVRLAAQEQGALQVGGCGAVGTWRTGGGLQCRTGCDWSQQ